MKKEQKRKRSKEEKGITLIALVITIIILLILAGVTLNAALSENGLFQMARKSADEYNKKAIEEQVQLLMAEKELESVRNGTNQKADITSVLEEMAGEDGITEDEIEQFNKDYLSQYNEKIIAIHNETEFNKIGKDEEKYPLSGTYVQVNDFDELNITQPIGTREKKEDGSVDESKSKPFTGVYNGNKKKITSLTITATNDYAGMFGYSEGTIRNITIKTCTVTSDYSKVGTIAGLNNGLIENCTVENGDISSMMKMTNEWVWCAVGGICGFNNGTIRGCENKAKVTGHAIGVGGIDGDCSEESVREWCKNSGNITGVSGVGGISGCGRKYKVLFEFR